MKTALRSTTLILLTVLFSSLAFARGKIDFVAGYFNLTAKNSRGTDSVSNVGAYQISYRRTFLQSLDLQIGYSLIASKVYTGDMGFGPDLGAVYFPFTSSGPTSLDTERVNLIIQEFFRPYFALGFHQRQYQSTQASYAGFSTALGTEYSLSHQYSIKSELRLINLAGPSQSTAVETDVFLGVTLHLP